jgi:hypothetical protein
MPELESDILEVGKALGLFDSRVAGARAKLESIKTRLQGAPMTGQIGLVYKKISAVASALCKEGISKDGKNQAQGFAFRGIDQVMNTLSPILVEHGLVILPRCINRVCTERPSAKGGLLFYTTVEAEFDFIASEDGSCHTVRTFGEAMDSGDKSTNKAMSAAYKYAAFQAFCIPTEGMPDADAETHEVAHQAQRQAPRPSPATPRQPPPAKKVDDIETMRAKTSAYFVMHQAAMDDSISAKVDQIETLTIDDMRALYALMIAKKKDHEAQGNQGASK